MGVPPCMNARIVFFFFKQKTAYEIPKRDWSSDVCSSDLGPSHSEGDSGSPDANELLHPASVAADVVAHWTVAGCVFGKFFGENSSLPFHSGSRLLIALANLRKRDDPCTKVRVTDTGCRCRFGQQAGFGHAGNSVDLQNGCRPVFGQNYVHPAINLETGCPKCSQGELLNLVCLFRVEVRRADMLRSAARLRI